MKPGSRDRLKLPGQTAVIWAEFAPNWYLRTYAQEPGDPESALRLYLDRGQRLGHAPNRLFDERWYVGRYEEVRQGLRDGSWESGFDHYCREGFRSHLPHWLYDDEAYCLRYPDLADDSLGKTGFVNRYDHYLKYGSKEGRIAHPLFAPAFYLARLPATEAVAARAVGAFMHYLQSLGSGQAERSASIYFDPEWYRARYPEVADAIGRGEWLSALHHYLGNHRPTDYDPVRFFSERYYRDEYPDVDAAIRREERRNGYDHFLSHGLPELRSPCPGVDLARYTTGEEGDDAFANLISAGPADLSVADLQASRLFHATADTLLTTYARAPLGFDCPGQPELSVIMVLQDRFATTMMALAALRDTYPGAVELILVDSGSTDATDLPPVFVDSDLSDRRQSWCSPV